MANLDLTRSPVSLLPSPVRAAPVSTTVTLDGGTPGDADLTCNGNVVITPTGTPPSGRTMVITCLANGAQRVPSMAASVALTTGLTDRSLTIPSGKLGVFVVRYSALGTPGWHLASAYLVT